MEGAVGRLTGSTMRRRLAQSRAFPLFVALDFFPFLPPLPSFWGSAHRRVCAGLLPPFTTLFFVLFYRHRATTAAEHKTPSLNQEVGVFFDVSSSLAALGLEWPCPTAPATSTCFRACPEHCFAHRERRSPTLCTCPLLSTRPPHALPAAALPSMVAPWAHRPHGAGGRLPPAPSAPAAAVAGRTSTTRQL